MGKTGTYYYELVEKPKNSTGEEEKAKEVKANASGEKKKAPSYLEV